MEASLQASNGPSRTRKRFVDAVQRIGPPLARGSLGDLARERVQFVVGGVEVGVEVERQPRPNGGAIGYWRCPHCDRRCCALFIVSGVLRCRKCHSLTYRSQHTLNPALTRAAKLRRKLGAAFGLLSRIPPRPPHWRRDYWARTLADLAAAESVIGELLGATLREVKRRKARIDGRR